MPSLKQLTANNAAAVLIGFIAWLAAHLLGADAATQAAIGTILFFIAHHYFHLPESDQPTGATAATPTPIAGASTAASTVAATPVNSDQGPAAATNG